MGITLTTSDTYKTGKSYIVSFKFKKIDGYLNDIGGHSTFFNTDKYILDHSNLGPLDYTSGRDCHVILDDWQEHEVVWYVTKLPSGRNSSGDP
jgi:hypothetical protein